MDFNVSADQRVKLKESERKDKYLDLAKKLKKKLWNMRVVVIPILIGALGTVNKGLIHELQDLEIKGRVGTIQITELLRTPGDLKKLAVTQTPVINHQLTLVWKTRKGVKW